MYEKACLEEQGKYDEALQRKAFPTRLARFIKACKSFFNAHTGKTEKKKDGKEADGVKTRSRTTT
jgi:hypothetical protein